MSTITRTRDERREGSFALVRRFELVVLEGADAGLRHATRGERTVLGTHRSADVALTDPTMSRFHCEIAIVQGKAVIRDLSSKNGTLVDGVRIREAELADGATLTLGRTVLRFELEDAHVRIPLADRTELGLLVGRSRAMRAAFALLERAAASDMKVLLLGETGTGKDLAARSIHLESERRRGPFVVVDCGAVAPSLIESELFGHERGAFTGADRARAGAFERAAGGTLFLDEIGELPLELQPKLLRALDSHEVRRVGGEQTIPVDLRVVAATNRDLRLEVNARRFRSDLYYRLAVVEIVLPPLREHLEDIPLLVEQFLSDVEEPGRELLRSKRFLAHLARHSWPGNVRELWNYLGRCLALGAEAPFGAGGQEAAPPLDVSQPLRVARDRWVAYFERRYLQELLRTHDGNVSAAARAAGIDRKHFYRVLAKSKLR